VLIYLHIDDFLFVVVNLNVKYFNKCVLELKVNKFFFYRIFLVVICLLVLKK
jgi:undecaprenyl pyrophosphate phosphatase UppP